MRTFACFQAHSLFQRTGCGRTLFPASRCVPRATMSSTATKYALVWIPVLLCTFLAFSAVSKHGRAVRSIWNGSNASAHLIVYSTTPSAEVAQKIASGLVQDRLVACVNTVPGVTSTYWWDGKVVVDQEHLLIMKTRQELLEELTKGITKLHPYDTPEVIAQAVVGGSQKYLDWIDDSTKTPGASAGESKAP